MKPLSDDELRKLYEEQIKPNLVDSVKSSPVDKTCIFLGGQPGSGKSYLNDISINTTSTKSAVVIDTDLIRNYHPQKALLPSKDQYQLDKDCLKIGEMIINDAIKEKKNILFDGTFGGANVEGSQKLMDKFKSEGYKIKLNLLATNDVVSKIGFNYRYELHQKLYNSGRPVELAYHNQVYQNIPNNLMKTLSKNSVDEFNIYGRNHVTKKLEKIHSYDSNDLKKNPSKAVVDYVKERTRPFDKEEIKELNRWCKNTEKLVESNKGDIKAFKASIHSDDKHASIELKNQIKEITGEQQITRKRGISI